MSKAKLPFDFNADDYLELNPDVKAAGEDPASHYINHGRAEKRSYRKGLPPDLGLRSKPSVLSRVSRALLSPIATVRRVLKLVGL
jgi:hypothetical protein